MIHFIFDFDGTLWDSSISVNKALKTALEKNGYFDEANNIPTFEIGSPIEIILEKEFSFSDNVSKNIAKSFRSYLEEEDLKSGIFYSNVIEVLEVLYSRGYLLSIATYKRTELVEKILQKYNIIKYFSNVIGSNKKIYKAKENMVNEIITGSKNVNSTFMVGDTYNDYAAAINNDIDFFLVSYGFGYKSFIKSNIKNRVSIIDNLKELLFIIKNY